MLLFNTDQPQNAKMRFSHNNTFVEVDNNLLAITKTLNIHFNLQTTVRSFSPTSYDWL